MQIVRLDSDLTDQQKQRSEMLLTQRAQAAQIGVLVQEMALEKEARLVALQELEEYHQQEHQYAAEANVRNLQLRV